MDRRTFLNALVGATALLTVSQVASAKRQLDELPADDQSPAPLVAGMHWIEAVPRRAALPTQPEEGTAAFVKDENECYVFIDDVGWIPFAALPPRATSET